MRGAASRTGGWTGAPALALTLAVAPWLPGAHVAHAQPPSVERTTEPVVVEEARPLALPEDPTAFTRVIEVDAFEGEGKRVEDLLEMVPGVHVRRFGGPGAGSEISIRGSTGAQVVVLLDGVRLNSAQSGSVDLSTIPQDLIERIEVTRGGGSVQSGSDAIGGVVNVVTRRASAAPHTSVSLAGGSFDTWQGSVTQTGRIGDNELLLGYDGFATSGDWQFEPVREAGIPEDTASVERVNNDSERHSGIVKLARDLGEHARVEIQDSLFQGSEGRPGLDLAAGGALRGQRLRAHQRRTRNAAQLRLLGSDLPWGGLGLDLRLFHRYERSRFRDPDLEPPLHRDDEDTSFGGRAELARGLVTGPFAHALTLGTALRRDDYDAEGDPSRDRRAFGLFAQDDVAVLDERVHVVPALRYDDTEGFDAEWIPRLGVALAPWPWLVLRGNAERSYRVPNFDELYFDEGTIRGDPSLRPEDAVNLDLGVELALVGWGPVSSIALEVAGFHNDIENRIVFQQVSPNLVKATNVGEATALGVELSAGTWLWRWIGLSGSWTWLDTEIERNGNPLPGRPEHEGDARLELAPFGGALKLVGAVLYTDEIPLDESGFATLSDRTTYDASASLDLVRLPGFTDFGLRLQELRVSVVATNLTDRAVRDAVGFPQPGRVLMFRLEATR